jgi:hypothetical protein
MSTVNRSRLLALSDKEFRREVAAPEPRPARSNFRPVRLNINKYDSAFDRKRGAAARMMAVLLRESDAQLTDRVCESAATCRTYGGAQAWLQGEARYLRKLAGNMDSAAGRLGVVLQRCGAIRSDSASSPPHSSTTN